jgi:hypothetical protein
MTFWRLLMSDITFPDAVTLPGGTRVITCESNPQAGVKIQIGPLTGVQIGAVLKLSWQGYNQNGAIPGTSTSLTHFVTEADTSEGLQKTISDYTNHIKPIRDGSAGVAYTINGGAPTAVEIKVLLLDSAGQTCDEVRP